MDPRLYHYEYRKPRVNNPTYQSINLYQSLYHRDIKNRYENNNFFISNNNNNSLIENHFNHPKKSVRNRQQLHKQAGSFIQKKQANKSKDHTNSVMIESLNPEMIRPSSNRSNQSNDCNTNQQRQSILASYGKNSMMHLHQNILQSKVQKNFQEKKRSSSGAYDRLNQFNIFQKQQKPYSIIGNYPRSTSTELKKYPKLTLEDKLIQAGKYYPSS